MAVCSKFSRDVDGVDEEERRTVRLKGPKLYRLTWITSRTEP